MKRFTKTLFIVLVAVAFVATGCKKESEYKTVTLGAKIAANNSKVYIDGITPIWQTGDQVRVNGTDESHTITVSQIRGNTAKLENVPQSDDGYYAIYPAEYATAFSGGQFAVTLPAFQEYTEVDGHQVVRAPMGAKTDTDGGSLTFHNLCSLLKVTVTAGETLKISEIKVTAGTTNLSGSTSIPLSEEGTYTLPAPATGSKSVTLSFGNSGKTLEAGNHVFYIYLPAFTSQNVSVEVYNIDANDVLGVKKQTFGDISVSANTINTVGTGSLTAASFTTTGAINSLFSVSADKKVRFSKGNLQYQASTSTWKFADQQYAFVGNAAGNTAESSRATQADWIDLFGWGTSGNNHGAIAYQPYAISDDDAHYYAYSNINLNLYDYGGTADWGSNTIAGTTGTWRTLNVAEWGYLMDTRTGNQVAHSYMKATINETTNGIIIFPDGYDFGENDATILGLISNYDAQDAAAIWATGTAWERVAKISSASWTTLQNAGCVFLPAAGVRSDSYVSDVGTDGQYWSSSAVDASSAAWPSARFMYFSTRDVSPQSYNQRSFGQSVRLVQDY
ncbi:MAG: hypothetical protein J6X88_04465 [Bacteroidales bacterium]|nr:hypothetical protein [Bacteroidales bacterium]